MKLARIITPQGPRTVLIRPDQDAAALLRFNDNVSFVADHPGPGHAVWSRVWKRMLVQAEAFA